MNSRTPLVRLGVVVGCAMLLGGCATVAPRASAVVFTKDGKRAVLSAEELAALRPAVAALLAELKLQLADNPLKAGTVTEVRIETAAPGGPSPVLSVERVTPRPAWRATRVFSGESAEARRGREPELPSQSDGVHPSVRLAENVNRAGQND